jgi:3-hydroxyisobutyrate dehydrogenase/2-hydroxy-3-oxopropionate reductase
MIKNIGFIGAGVMGKSMIRNLIKNGFTVSFYTRTKAKALDLIDEGVAWCDSAAACAAGKDAVITIIGYPKDVEETYFGEGGIIAAADPGTLLIDMTTSSPQLAVRIREAAAAAGKRALDAPVSGGDTGARAGTLSIMVGGSKADYEDALPVFQAMGTTIIYEGGAGCGQHTKMANQIAIAGCVAGVSEAIAYAGRTGLDVQTMFDSISKGAAGSWQLTNNGQKMIDHNYDPGFFIKHFIKDMKIAVEEAKEAGLDIPVTDLVLSAYRKLEDEGLGDLDTQALIKYYTD